MLARVDRSCFISIACRRVNPIEVVDVRYWHLADTSQSRSAMSAIGGKADIGWTCSKMRLGKQTQIGLLPRFTASHQGQTPLIRS
jgi:hypothetical protein